MKKTIILLTIITIAFACSNKKNDNPEDKKTLISGKIENPRELKLVLAYNDTNDTITLNDNGEFSAELNIATASHIVLSNGDNHCRIYINPKSKLNLTANNENFFESLKYSGDDADINNFLAKQQIIIKDSKINSEQFLYSGEYKTFKKSLDKLSTSLFKNLDNFNNETKKKHTEFVALEKIRIQLICGSIMLTYYAPLVTTNEKNLSFENELNSLIESTDFNNEKIIQLYELKPYSENLIAYKLNNKVKTEKLEIITGEQYAEFYFGIIDETFVNKVVKEDLYYFTIKDFVNYYGVETVLKIYEKYSSFATNTKRKEELESIFAEYRKLAAGQASVNWSFQDLNGKTISLSDFKGKYVYIDVWASWCGPCVQEIPYLKIIKEKFKGKNIEIIGISVDEEKSKWEEMIVSQGLTGIQLYANGWNNSLCEFFKINSIPRFILIDKSGNIINSNAARPSGDIEKVLSELEGI